MVVDIRHAPLIKEEPSVTYISCSVCGIKREMAFHRSILGGVSPPEPLNGDIIKGNKLVCFDCIGITKYTGLTTSFL